MTSQVLSSTGHSKNAGIYTMTPSVNKYFFGAISKTADRDRPAPARCARPPAAGRAAGERRAEAGGESHRETYRALGWENLRSKTSPRSERQRVPFSSAAHPERRIQPKHLTTGTNGVAVGAPRHHYLRGTRTSEGQTRTGRRTRLLDALSCAGSLSELPALGVLSRVSRDWWLNCTVRVKPLTRKYWGE